jgi:hypothetical protein
MSWFNNNYDKAVLGLAGVTLLGVGAAILTGGNATEPSTKGGKENETYPWDGLKEKIATNLASLAAPNTTGVKVWQTVKLNPTQEARLLQGPPLVQKSGDEKPFILLAPDAPNIRGQVPNAWFVKFGVDITRSKILERDDDSDKFSNLEEYLGESNPKDPNSYPSAIMKLKLVEVSALKCELKFKANGQEYQIKRTQELAAGQPVTSKNDLTAAPGKVLDFKDTTTRFKFESLAEETIDGRLQKVATVSDSLITVGSPFKIPDGVTVDRPTMTAKIACTLAPAEELVVKEGDALEFKAFPTIKFKLLKINPDSASPSVVVEYAESGKPAKSQQIKKN